VAFILSYLMNDHGSCKTYFSPLRLNRFISTSHKHHDIHLKYIHTILTY